MKQLMTAWLIMIALVSNAQKEEYDMVSYTPPQGWKKETKTGVVCYTGVDAGSGSWCQLLIYQSVAGKGSVEADFSSEWSEVAVRFNGITEAPQLGGDGESDGWKIRSGVAPFTFNNKPSIAWLTVFSGYGKCISIMARTNKKEYLEVYHAFLSGLEIKKPAVAPPAITPQATLPSASGGQSGFRFTTTHFDDGWTSTPKDDWVEVTKADLKVLIHYTHTAANGHLPDREEAGNIAWNTFITSRYSHITHFEKLRNNLGYIQVLFMAGNMTDQNGANVFVALFRQGNKNSNWIEIICPSRAEFTRAFGIDQYDHNFDGWEVLAKLAGYNRFAVDPTDLKGKWTSNFSGMTQYVNVYTGADAGINTYSSNQQFIFANGKTYNWEIKAASGFTGNIKFQGAKSTGSFSMPDNWTLHLSDIEGKPRTYPVQFTCTKAGRLLWIDGTAFAGID